MPIQFIPGFIPSIQAPDSTPEPNYWLLFCGQQLVATATQPYVNQAQPNGHYLGQLNGQGCWVAEVPAPLPHTRLIDLKAVYAEWGEAWFNIAGRALQILNWDRNHQFCGRCGSPTYSKVTERAKACPKCQLLNYPRLSPSIIVMITRGKQILLARSPHFPPGLYSVLAGFIEPGETAEQAVEREVFEEVGIAIQHIRYIGSQSWPFPDAFMLGFRAEYASGEITIDGLEIADANWYSIDNLPLIPTAISISRRLINLFLDEQHAALRL